MPVKAKRPLSRKNLLGKTFGKLTVIGSAGTRGEGSRKAALWKCRCVCGATKTIVGSQLVSGHTKSCGCLKMDRLLAYNESRRTGKTARDILYQNYRHNAERRNIPFEISIDYFSKLTREKCFYCGEKPSTQKWITGQTGESCMYNGVDRSNNKLGYTEENTVPCCSHCNWCKHTMTQKEFLDTVKRIYFYQKQKEEIR